jgi:hypothetical protein
VLPIQTSLTDAPFSSIIKESPVGPPIILSAAFGVIVMLNVKEFPELVSFEPTSTKVKLSPGLNVEPAGSVIVLSALVLIGINEFLSVEDKTTLDSTIPPE